MFQGRFNFYLKLKIFVIAAVGILLFASIEAYAQQCKGAIVKDRLVAALRGRMQNSQQLSSYIKLCGVDFQLTPQIENELISAGARPEVIEAVRGNFRGATRTNTGGNSGGNTGANSSANALTKQRLIATLRAKNTTNGAIIDSIEKNGVSFKATPADERELVAAGASPAIIVAVKNGYRDSASGGGGGPLTKDEVVSLFQKRMSDAQVQTNVKSRGVAFQMNPVISREIKLAGGSDTLINLMTMAYVPPSTGTATGRNTVSNTISYEDLIDRSVELYDNKTDRAGAMKLLQDAVRMEPNNPRAYQLLGFMNLYGFSNFMEAEKYMTEAIARGGAAVFRVFHDDDGFFGVVCEGSLYITKNVVRFESDTKMADTFETDISNVTKVEMIGSGGFFDKLNQMMKAKKGTFRVRLKSGDNEAKRYGFAPLTENDMESKMIVRLIGKK
jgi:hypothetical protein